jgi:hypothetical protein
VPVRNVLLATCALTLAVPASASVIIDDSFDEENGGDTSLDHDDFANFDVVNGTIDVVKNGDFGLACPGGPGSCVDLDGSTNDGGRLIMKNAFATRVGERFVLSVDFSGNQRGGGEEFGIGFLSDVLFQFNDRQLFVNGVFANSGGNGN